MKRKQKGYQNDPIEIETLYKAEEPFMAIEQPFFGYQGVILRNKVNDTIQCHYCGLWFKYLAPHLKHGHKTNVHEYKKKFSLPMTAALCSKKLSETARENALKWESHHPMKANQGREIKERKNWRRNLKYSLNNMGRINAIGACEEQVQKRYISIMDFLGREPGEKDLAEHDSALRAIIHRRFGGLNAFKEKYSLGTVRNRWNREKIVAAIREKYKTKKSSLKISDFETCPSRRTIIKKFGSWNRALTAAGIV